ncbi:MAG: hypothetical protein AAF376_08885 [Pseudomonadota bacterium]
MSNLNQLATRVARRIHSSVFAVDVEVADNTGTTTRSAPQAPRAGAKVNPDKLLARLGRVMAAAHPGAALTVTTPDDGKTYTLTAPGGAFDNRAGTPAPVQADGPESPSPDIRLLTAGERLTQAPRALMICGPGTLQVRTLGTPGEYQPPFEVAAIPSLPIRVLEIGPLTTAGPIFGLY